MASYCSHSTRSDVVLMQSMSVIIIICNRRSNGKRCEIW